jgi:hypothetical protein
MATKGPSAGPCGNEVAADVLATEATVLIVFRDPKSVVNSTHTGIHFRVGVCHSLTMNTPLLPAESGKFSPRAP